MRSLLLIVSMVPIVLAANPPASAQEEAAPQNDWMVHMDKSAGDWRYVPARIVLVPGGTVQLMVFGNGQFSIVLDEDPRIAADISTPEGTIRTAELTAPLAPGEHAFHDKYHPEARGVLVVREREDGRDGGGPGEAAHAQPATAMPTIGVVPGGYESRFAPARIEVDAGAEVRFTANGTFGHNLQAVDGSFAAGDLAPGGSTTFRAPMSPGEHAFECRFHKEQGMVGVLVVRAPAAAPSVDGTAEEARAPEERGVGGLALGMGLLTVALCALLAANARQGEKP